MGAGALRCDWRAYGSGARGAGGGRGERCQRGYKGGKSSCAGSWVGARSYGSRSGGAGPQKTGGGGGSPRERDYVPLGVSL